MLAVAVAALSAFAVFTLARDRHRALVQHRLATWLAGLSIARSFTALLLLGGGAAGLMVIADGDEPSDLGTWLSLGLILAVTSLALTFVALALGHIALAFSRRLIVALLAVLRTLERLLVPLHALRRVAVARQRRPPLAMRYGLRAPPGPGGRLFNS